MILLYHGVVDDYHPRERWCVGQALPLPEFRWQLDWLVRHREIVPLRDYLDLKSRGERAVRNAVALTFDDGLAGTFAHVYPELVARRVPATIFVSTAHLEPGTLLWCSALNALCFERFYDRLSVDGVTYPLTTLDERRQSKRGLLRKARESGDPRAFVQRLMELYPLPGEVIERYAGMTPAQFAACRDSDLLQLEAHTVTHPSLSQLSPEHQSEELIRGKEALSERTDKPVRYFAYPNGEYTAETLRLVEEAGYEAAFATIPRNLGGEAGERYEIERMGIYSASRFRFLMKAWGAGQTARRLGLRVG